MLLISGEPHASGHTYRVRHIAENLEQLGWEVTVLPIGDLRWRLYLLWDIHWVHLWRVDMRSFGQDWERFLRTLQSWDIRFSYDLDDYLFDPRLATPAMMGWMRLTDAPEAYVQTYIQHQQQLMGAADCFTAPTEYLVEAGRTINKTACCLPNGFDTQTLAYCDQLWGQSRPADGLIRIGYAGGSLTHQRDFGQIIPALIAVLTRYPPLRLVVFGQALRLEEFPELLLFQDQIEDRAWVSQAELPRELWRFDINLAPLELQPFCHGKSELKYFEAALLGVPTIASPTAPFQAAISPGVNGLLATTVSDWEAALMRLIENPEQRRSMGAKARTHAMIHFGPKARRAALTELIKKLKLPVEPGQSPGSPPYSP